MTDKDIRNEIDELKARLQALGAPVLDNVAQLLANSAGAG